MKTQYKKKALFICSLTLMFVICFSNSQEPAKTFNPNTAICLVISGNVYTGDNNEDTNVKVELIYYNTLIDSLIVENNKKFEFI